MRWVDQYQAFLISGPIIAGLTVWIILASTADPRPAPVRNWAPPGTPQYLRTAGIFERHACACEDPECADAVLKRMAAWAYRHVHSGPAGEAATKVQAHLASAFTCARERPVGPPQRVLDSLGARVIQGSESKLGRLDDQVSYEVPAKAPKTIAAPVAKVAPKRGFETAKLLADVTKLINDLCACKDIACMARLVQPSAGVSKRLRAALETMDKAYKAPFLELEKRGKKCIDGLGGLKELKELKELKKAISNGT